MFITAFKRGRHLPLSWARSIYAFTTDLRHILILFTHLQQGLPSGLSLSLLNVSPPSSCMDLSSPPERPHSAHLILYLMTRIMFGEQYRSRSSSCSLLQFPVTSSHLGPNIFLSTLFSDTLSLCFSFCVWDQVSHPCQTTGNITILHILMCIFLENELSGRRL